MCHPRPGSASQQSHFYKALMCPTFRGPPGTLRFPHLFFPLRTFGYHISKAGVGGASFLADSGKWGTARAKKIWKFRGSFLPFSSISSIFLLAHHISSPPLLFLHFPHFPPFPPIFPHVTPFVHQFSHRPSFFHLPPPSRGHSGTWVFRIRVHRRLALKIDNLSVPSQNNELGTGRPQWFSLSRKFSDALSNSSTCHLVSCRATPAAAHSPTQ